MASQKKNKLSDEDVLIGWSFNNEIQLLIEELELIRDQENDLASKIQALQARKEGINVIEKFIIDNTNRIRDTRTSNKQSH